MGFPTMRIFSGPIKHFTSKTKSCTTHTEDVQIVREYTTVTTVDTLCERTPISFIKTSYSVKSTLTYLSHFNRFTFSLYLTQERKGGKS